LSFLAGAYVDLGQFDDAWSCIGEAMTAIEKETWCEAEVNRIAGEVTLKSPQLNAATAEGYFERALAVARQQQAKSCVTRVVGARGLVDGRGKRKGPVAAGVQHQREHGRSTHTLGRSQGRVVLETL
jgi:hypothetical protein